MMSDNIGNPLHTGISVYDMEESIAWYEKNLGFLVVKDEGFIALLRAHVVFLRRDNYEIELFQFETPIPLPKERLAPNTDLQTVGTKHLAFATDDMVALRARFADNGVEIVHEVTMDGEAVMFIHDCNGVLIEFIQH
ncbi:MAG: hypothetical protein DBX49_06795 [Clostridia bacterium]|nr:MAG: hypothetical protein DBX49_06795 [Clostridia bacterium]